MCLEITIILILQLPGLGNFELVNLRSDDYVIGTARIKSIQQVGGELRIYLMDIQLKGLAGSNHQLIDIKRIERHGDFDTAPHSFGVQQSASSVGVTGAVIKEQIKILYYSQLKDRDQKIFQMFRLQY